VLVDGTWGGSGMGSGRGSGSWGGSGEEDGEGSVEEVRWWRGRWGNTAKLSNNWQNIPALLANFEWCKFANI
jgi:hypothetical protein